jgi:hypothetical protein
MKRRCNLDYLIVLSIDSVVVIVIVNCERMDNAEEMQCFLAQPKKHILIKYNRGYSNGFI